MAGPSSERQNFTEEQIRRWTDAHPELADELAVLNGARRVASYYLSTVPARLQTIGYSERVIGEPDRARRREKMRSRIEREAALAAGGVVRESIISSKALVDPALDHGQLSAIIEFLREGDNSIGLIPDCDEADALPGVWPDEIGLSHRSNLIVASLDGGVDRVMLDDGFTLIEEGRTANGLIAVAQHLSSTALRGQAMLVELGYPR